MTAAPYVLVLISAFTHAYWNFLLQRARGTQVFIGLSKLAEVALFLVPFVWFAARDGSTLVRYWPYCVVGAVLVVLNYIFLGKAYAAGALSLVYPTARGASLFFLPILGWLWTRESVDAIGILSIGLIVAGLAVIHLEAFRWNHVTRLASRFRDRAIVYALLAAFTTACYTLWDKRSVSVLAPFLYFYAYTAITGLAYGLFILVRYPAAQVRTEWAANKSPILQVGFFNAFTYLLVLYSLQSGKASYVIALRQLSIGFGVLIGWKILKEEFPVPKRAGLVLLLAGCLLISLAR